MSWLDLLKLEAAIILGVAAAAVAIWGAGTLIGAIYILCFELITGKNWHLRDKQ